MSEKLQLKPISASAIPDAIKKAEQYRNLNDPEPAQSICLDILGTDPTHQRALVVLILAITDGFATDTIDGVKRAQAAIAKLNDEYERAYYDGIVLERKGRALLGRGRARVFAYDHFRRAMECYEKAEALSPANNDDAILRWNSCVRTIHQENLHPMPPEEGPGTLLE